MADNFNLRAFLAENKLTTSSRILNENVNRKDEQLLSSFSDPKTGISPIDMQNFIKSNSGKYIYNYFEPVDDIDEKLEVTPEQALAIVLAMNGKGEIPASLPQGYDARLYFSNNETNLDEADWRNNPYTPHNFDGVAAEAKKHKHLMKIANELFPQYGGNLENFKPLSPLERQQVYKQYTADTKVIPFKESKLTAKERRLVEMVQDALGIAPQAVAEEAPMAEDEMVQENPLPKYKNIDELMSSIEHGTNEAAHKYKMERMKEVAEALEAKVSSLEEGENAEHIDQKAVKQMRKDILALRKGEEKLRKEFEKKFAAKKEKKEDK